MKLSEAFKADYFRTVGTLPHLGVKLGLNCIFRHNVRFLFWLRRHTETKSLFSRYKLYRYSRKYGLEFSPNTRIGDGLYLGHPYNITVGDGVVIGRNVNIHKGATIGVENRGSRAGAPTIGNNVYIGINASIIGKIYIGDDVLIAPGAFINFDVPSHSIVVGNPGVIHPCKNATKDYVRNCV